MSLLTSVNSGSPNLSYFIQNIGGNGAAGNSAPCIKGTAFGAVRVGDPAVGIVIRGDATGAGFIRGGGATSAGGSSVTIGASSASASNIVLTDGFTTVTGTLSVPGAGDISVGDDISLGGDLIFTNGATGSSITGFYFVTTAVAAAGAQANPAGLTAGTYLVVYVPTASTPGIEGQQPSGVFYWSGVSWAGNAVGANFSAPGPGPDIAILPTAGNATLTVGGSTPSVPGSLFWRKLLG